MYEDLFNQKKEEIIQKLEKVGFPRIEISLEIKRLTPRVAGYAHPYSYLVEINELYLKDNLQEMSNQILAHEICHIYNFEYNPEAKQHHGPEWKNIMKSIGYAPDTRHRMKIAEMKPKQKRKKVRYIYTNGVKKCYVTKQQHEKLTNGKAIGKLQGHPIVWTGEIKEYV